MSNFEGWGHFSQVVWVGSAAVGCASHYCASGTIFSTLPSWFTVCNYVPPGMFIFFPRSLCCLFLSLGAGFDFVLSGLSANIRDAGNYLGEFGTNVFPPLGQAAITVPAASSFS